MDLEEIGLFGSGLELLESPCECGIEPSGSISHGVSYATSILQHLADVESRNVNIEEDAVTG